jgi:exo-beta-1,3-glucanase (GH17 family)
MFHELVLSGHSIIRTYTNASVVAASLAIMDNWTSYLQALYAFNDAASIIEVQGVHLYGDSESNIAVINTVKGITQKPIWVTEIGRPSESANFTDQEQATYLTANFGALKSHADKIFWYELYDESGATPDTENHFGLQTLSGTKKPSFNALREITKR